MRLHILIFLEFQQPYPDKRWFWRGQSSTMWLRTAYSFSKKLLVRQTLCTTLRPPCYRRWNKAEIQVFKATILGMEKFTVKRKIFQWVVWLRHADGGSSMSSHHSHHLVGQKRQVWDICSSEEINHSETEVWSEDSPGKHTWTHNN